MTEPKSTHQVWAAYVRVSSEEQADKDTCETQRREITRWAKVRGHAVVFYEDVGVSGGTFRRANWTAMMRDLMDDTGHLVGVVAASLDRLTCAGLGSWFEQLDAILRAGKTVVTIRELQTIRPSDAVASFVSNELANARDSMKNRLENGLARARAKGVKFGRPRKLFDVAKYAYYVRERRMALCTAARIVEWHDERGRSGVGIAPNILRARFAEYDGQKKNGDIRTNEDEGGLEKR